VTAGVEVASGGSSLYVSGYAETAGVQVARRLPRGAEVAFLAEFEVPDRLPVMESPILCDATWTWMGATRLLSWTADE
jgi:hypothetical protein